MSNDTKHSGQVDVIAVIRKHAESHRALAGSDAYSEQEATKLEATLAAVAELIEAQKATRRELHACQAVIHLAGGFDPAYVTGAQAAIKQADAALANVGSAL